MKQKIIEIIKKAINSIAFVVIIGIIIFGKTMLFYNQTIGQIELSTILKTISFIAVLVAILCAIPNRARIVGAIIADIIISVLLFADHTYYVYSRTTLSVAQFTNLQYGEEITKAIPIMLSPMHIFYFVDFIILLIFHYIKEIKIERLNKASKKTIIARCASVIAGIALFIRVCAPAVESSSNAPYVRDMQIKEATIYGYHIFDIKSAFTKNNQTKYKNRTSMIEDYEKLKAEYNEKYGQVQYDLEGSLKDKNIIIVQLESLQNFLINQKINGKEITPNLNKFFSENIEFTNMYMQSYTTTADSEHSVLTSTYPIENGMAFSRYYTNTYDDLFNIFHSNDYYTSYMHGNDAYFWNRGNVYRRLPVDSLALKDSFEEEEYINGYLSDETVYKQGLEKIENFDKPFISFIVAASSHLPYELEGLQDRSKVSIDTGKYKNTYFGNYLEAANYADYAFGVFLEGLKEKGLYDNTAILVYGDHNGLNMYEEKMIEFFEEEKGKLTDVDIRLNFANVLCGLRIPGISNIKIDKPVTKLDVKPTLTYLCGIEDGFSLGTNVFESKDFVCLNNELIITDKYYYDEGWYDRKTGETIDIELIDEELRTTLNKYYDNMKIELDISNSIVYNDLLSLER